MDITDTLAPNSTQLDAEDLLVGPRTFTIEKVTKGGSAEQPVDIHLIEFPGRPFRPSKTVRRLIVAAWGPDASTYTGRRLTLYRDPEVKFGGMKVGGIRLSHASHLDKPILVALMVTRGKRELFTVQPLPDTPDANEFMARIDAAQSLDELNAIGADIKAAGIRGNLTLKAEWTSRKAALTAAPTTDDAALDAAQEAEEH